MSETLGMEEKYQIARDLMLSYVVMGMSYAKTKGYGVKDFADHVASLSTLELEDIGSDASKLLEVEATFQEVAANAPLRVEGCTAEKCSAVVSCWAAQQPYAGWLERQGMTREDACTLCDSFDDAVERATGLKLESKPEGDDCRITIGQ